MENKYVNDFNETVKKYYKDLSKFTPMSKDEERKLLIRAKNNDIYAQNKILEANLKFVFEIAKRYKGHGVPLEDLISEGNLGLIKAIYKFDLSKDVKFFSYAVWWIKQYIISYVKKNYKKESVEQSDQETFYDNYDNDKVADFEDDRINIMDVIMSNEKDIIEDEVKREQHMLISHALKSLDERSRIVVEMYYGLNGDESMTLSEIGDCLDLSKERIRQICSKALKHIKNDIVLEMKLSRI